MLKKRITILGKSMPILLPVAVALVVVSIAVAAVLLTVTQTITQKIVQKEVPPPPDYGSIVAPAIGLSEVQQEGSVNYSVTDGVVVDLKADGANKTLKAVLTPSDAHYSAFAVTLTCTMWADGACPEAGAGDLAVDLGSLEASVTLEGVGTYKFSETINATAGTSLGVAVTKLALTLED